MFQHTETFGGVKDKPKKSAQREIFESLLIAVVLALIIRTFAFQPFFIPSGSMEPTLQIHDHILVNKFSYRFWDLQRGDIVVFKYPLDPKRDFVKRLIGLPGETVQVKNNKVYVSGREIQENYLPAGWKSYDYGPVVVPENSYFMMGDNRNNSDDSRVWGALPKDLVIGKSVVVYWPFDRVRLLSGK